jgi:2-keto-3-deoxy-L-fuconate dehydrogenase
VRDFEAIRAAAAEAGDVDILLNAAGFVHQGTVLDCDEKSWDFSFDLNVKSVYRTLHAFLPRMIARRRGSIVSIASVARSIRGVPNRAAYGATKAALIGLTKAVAADTVAHGVRVNAICPGTVETPSLQGRINQNADPAAARAGVHRAAADGPARDRRGDRAARGLPRKRRVELHDGRRPCDRRRVDDVIQRR